MNKKQITYSPIDNSIYVERDQANDEQIDQCLTLASYSQKQWRLTAIAQRAEICHKMVDAMIENEAEIAEQLCWMMGRPIQYAKGEVAGMAERARYMIDIAEQSLATTELEDKPCVKRYIKREPLGVVFVIAPWNYPYLTAVNVIIPAIMAGNGVVLKHSKQTPLCAEQFAAAFEKAELPQGVFQYLHLSHSHTEKVIADDHVNYVAFTGSVAGGEMVERVSAGKFIGLGLELGGKDPAYVRFDANIQDAVATCIDGAFFNSGQSCCAIERIYVAAAIFDDFVEQAITTVNSYRLGRSDDVNTTLGPMVSTSAANVVRQQITQAQAAGAIAHINPDDFPLNTINSAYLAPQVLTAVDHTMSIMTEESFGPVVGIMKVENDQQAIELMNDSHYGLTASVFTSDIDAGVAIGEQLSTGTFFINRCDYLDPELAWVGVKNSGRGCTLSSMGYAQLTRPKSFHLKISS